MHDIFKEKNKVKCYIISINYIYKGCGILTAFDRNNRNDNIDLVEETEKFNQEIFSNQGEQYFKDDLVPLNDFDNFSENTANVSNEEGSIVEKKRKNTILPTILLFLIIVIIIIVPKIMAFFNIKADNIENKAIEQSSNVQKEIAPYEATTKVQSNSKKATAEKIARLVVYSATSTSEKLPTSMRLHPFLPMNNLSMSSSDYAGSYEVVMPTSIPKSSDENIEKMMKTTVSGILYDKHMPSAIINLDGKDQLVRKGDRIGGFLIMAITQDKVIMRYGNNVYRVSVGQSVNDEGINFTEIPNLKNSFGGKASRQRS